MAAPFSPRRYRIAGPKTRLFGRTLLFVLTDGRRLELDVDRLSIEQRQSLLNAIVRYGRLVEEK